MDKEINDDALDSLKGRSVIGWQYGEGGMHIELDDGKIIIIMGQFVIGLYTPEDSHALH